MKRILTQKLETVKKMTTKYLAKLTEVCKSCSPETVKVYFRNTKRLYKLTNEGDDIPVNSKWLKNEKLVKKYKSQPLKIRRHLSVAAVKFFQAVKEEPGNWYKYMVDDNKSYQDERGKNQKTEAEKELWPKKGYKAIRQAATEYWRRNKHEITNGDKTLRKLYSFQTFIVLRMFSEVPMRNTFADFFLVDVKGKNYVDVPKKGAITLVVRDYKSSKQLGEKKVKLSRGLTTQVRKFLKFREGVVDNNFFLNTLKGEKMTRSTLGKMLQRNTKKILNKSIGSRIIRLLAVTNARASIEKVAELSNKLLHTSAQTKQYVRKD